MELQGTRGRVGGLANRHLHFSHLPSFPPQKKIPAQTSSMQTSSHCIQPVHCGPPTLSTTDTSESQWRHNPDSAWDPPNAPTSRCDFRTPNVTGEGTSHYFLTSKAGLYLNHLRQMANSPILKDLQGGRFTIPCGCLF